MRSSPLAVAVLMSACTPSVQSGESSPGVELDVAPDEVAAGDSVTLELDNESPGRIGYNLCNSALERRVGDGWQSVPSNRACTLELRILAPGAQAGYAMRLPDGLAPGEYRYLTNVEMLDTGERAGLHSETFRVRP